MIAFVHIQKTAGSTVKFILRNSFGIQHCDIRPLGPEPTITDADLRFARRSFPALKSIAGHALVHAPAALSGDISYFTFLREPLERYASLYQFRRQDPGRRSWRDQPRPSLEAFLADPRFWNGQVTTLVGEPNLDLAIEELETQYRFVGLTERFDESLRVWERLCPYPLDLRYRKANVAPTSAIKDQLLGDAQVRATMLEANQLDVALYRHVQTALYPAQRRQAGLEGDPGGPLEDHAFVPWKYHLNRLYNNAVYRPLWKLSRRRPADQPWAVG